MRSSTRSKSMLLGHRSRSESSRSEFQLGRTRVQHERENLTLKFGPGHLDGVESDWFAPTNVAWSKLTSDRPGNWAHAKKNKGTINENEAITYRKKLTFVLFLVGGRGLRDVAKCIASGSASCLVGFFWHRAKKITASWQLLRRLLLRCDWLIRTRPDWPDRSAQTIGITREMSCQLFSISR